MKNYVQAGATLTLVATAAVESGALVVAGSAVGFAQTDAEIGDSYAIVTDGVYAVSVLTATPVAVGDIVYATPAGTLKLTSASAVRAGVAWSAGASDGTAASIHLKLNA